MNIKITYFPNGKYNKERIPSGNKCYCISIISDKSEVSDTVTGFIDISKDQVHSLLSLINKNKEDFLIKKNRLGNGIIEFKIKQII